jgi:site-specific recombinase XerD
MFEQLFTYRGVRSRHQHAPLVHERERYLADRAAAGFAPATLKTLAQELRIIAEACTLPDDGPIDVATIALAAVRWAHQPPSEPHTQERHGPQVRFIRVATKWFRFLGRLDEPAGDATPCTGLLEAFASCLRHERGFSSKTIGTYTWYARQFCQWFSTQQSPFAAVTVRDVDGFLAFHGQHCCRVSVATAAKALRSFFRYAEHHQECPVGLAAAIESPRLFHHETLPAGPTWTEVQRLLTQTDTDHPRDIRDRAMLILLAVYGLRSGEVAALRLDQLDWAHEQITIVRTKQRCTQIYPLSQPLGLAVLRYLQEVRPRGAWPEIFLTLRAPVRPLSPGALYHLTCTRLAQVGYAGAHAGPHTLRHACAAHLVACHLSLKEIGDHLGHRSPSATRTYAKVDMEGLRDVARFDVGELL